MKSIQKGMFQKYTEQMLNTADDPTVTLTNPRSFTFTSTGLSQPLSDEVVRGLVSRDNYCGRNRFLLGSTGYAPQPCSNSPSRPGPYTTISPSHSSRPPDSVFCYFHSTMLKVLAREGINPKRRSSANRSSLPKYNLPTTGLRFLNLPDLARLHGCMRSLICMLPSLLANFGSSTPTTTAMALTKFHSLHSFFSPPSGSPHSGWMNFGPLLPTHRPAILPLLYRLCYS